MCFLMKGFMNRSLSGSSPRTCLPWETLPGAEAPDSIAPGITRALKPLHHIKGNELKKGKITGTSLTEYHPPTPPQKSGFHRYQIMLFEQLPHTPVSLSDEEKSSRGKWDFPAFITRFNLGEPVAALQFLTQNFKD